MTWFLHLCGRFELELNPNTTICVLFNYSIVVYVLHAYDHCYSHSQTIEDEPIYGYCRDQPPGSTVLTWGLTFRLSSGCVKDNNVRSGIWKPLSDEMPLEAVRLKSRELRGAQRDVPAMRKQKLTKNKGGEMHIVHEQEDAINVTELWFVDEGIK